jgi:hypothetical protein
VFQQNSNDDNSEEKLRYALRTCHVIVLLVACTEICVGIWVASYNRNNAVVNVMAKNGKRARLSVAMYAASFLLTGAVMLVAGFIGTVRTKEVGHGSLSKGNASLVHLMALVVSTGLLILQLLGSTIGLTDMSAQPYTDGRDQARRLLVVLTCVSCIAFAAVVVACVASATRLCSRRQ